MRLQNGIRKLCMGIAGVIVFGLAAGGSISAVYANGNSRAGEVPINESTFPDPVLRQWVLNTYDKDHDSNLSATERATVEKITTISTFTQSSQGMSVKDWAGIEYFTGITEFSLINYSVTCEAVTIDLSSNTKLERIEVSGARNLTTLNVAGLTSLKSISCSSTSIDELNISGMSQLENLLCSYTYIKKLDLTGLSSLKNLTCSRAAIEELKVNGAEALETLICDYTSISELDLSGLTRLKNVDCANTSIKKLDISDAVLLEILDCSDCLISELNVGSLTKLYMIECRNNELTGLDVSGLTGLLVLNCEGNQLTSLDLSHNASINLKMSSFSDQELLAPLYYDGDCYYVDLTVFSDFDKTCFEALDSIGSPYEYNNSSGRMESQAALQVGDKLYYNYNTGTTAKMQVIVGISEMIDLTPPTTEATTQAPATITTEAPVTTEKPVETSAPTEATTESEGTTEQLTTETGQSSETEGTTGTSAGTSGNSTTAASTNVQKQNTPKTGDSVLLIWIGTLGVFAMISFLVTGRKQ